MCVENIDNKITILSILKLKLSDGLAINNLINRLITQEDIEAPQGLSQNSWVAQLGTFKEFLHFFHYVQNK